MMISSRGTYALRVLIDLAAQPPEAYTPLKEIVRRQDVSQKYLESTPIIRGINGTELVDLVLKYYGDLDEKYKQVIPLKMVYIPIAKE